MQEWDAGQYLHFCDERTRPATDRATTILRRTR